MNKNLQKANWVQELKEMEKSFCRDTMKNGAKGWAKYFGEFGKLVGKKGDLIEGPASIYDAMNNVFSLPGYSLIWDPIHADVSDDGTLGFTYGNYVRKWLEDGIEKEETGRYMTIWKKNEKNEWQIEADIGN